MNRGPRIAALLSLCLLAACGDNTGSAGPSAILSDGAPDVTSAEVGIEAAADSGAVDTDSGPNSLPEAGADVPCVSKTCAQLGAECGQLLGTCGLVLQCGECGAGRECGGAGPNKCGAEVCHPKTCAQLGASCGVLSDQCSNLIECGSCTPPEECGEPNPNQCGCVCELPHATTDCLAGVCSVQQCEEGWANCNNVVEDGCETEIQTNHSNCGSCGVACASNEVCAAGQCECSPTKVCGGECCPLGKKCCPDIEICVAKLTECEWM